MKTNNTATSTIDRADMVRETYADIFRVWHDSIDGANDVTDAAVRRRLAVGMAESLAIRDAIICCVFSPDADTKCILDLAVHPHAKENVAMMNRSLSAAFDTPTERNDQRCATAVSTLIRMVNELENDREEPALLAQPLAAIAYLQWFSGRRAEAAESVKRALAADESNNLAHIVETSVRYDINPGR